MSKTVKKKKQEKYMTKYLKDRYRKVKCNVNQISNELNHNID